MIIMQEKGVHATARSWAQSRIAQNGGYEEAHAADLIKQVLSGVAYLHSKGTASCAASAQGDTAASAVPAHRPCTPLNEITARKSQIGSAPYG